MVSKIHDNLKCKYLAVFIFLFGRLTLIFHIDLKMAKCIFILHGKIANWIVNWEWYVTLNYGWKNLHTVYI